ncbi:MAG TPA: preprotein translocase subunit SecG [Pyrinomonadaceae bacterium]|nr:preprotein translocase subunit SecG [Pyrinomonadaceae bacterium]
MLQIILYGLFILACVVLIVSVLLQPGKADAGALFSSSVSSTAFGPRGTQTLLAKITIGAAALFMLVALTLSLPALTQSRSVLQTQSEAEPAATPQPTVAPATNAPTAGATTAPEITPQPATTPGQ